MSTYSLRERALHIGLLGFVFLALCLFGGLALPVLAILAISAGLDGHYVSLILYSVVIIVIFYLLDFSWEKLKSIWRQTKAK